MLLLLLRSRGSAAEAAAGWPVQRPGPVGGAVARAVRHTGPAIATAGLVLAGSFATLATIPGSEQVAFAMTLGILLSAVVLSLVLVPAVAALLGRTLWWPLRPTPRHGPTVQAPDRVPVSWPPAPCSTCPPQARPALADRASGRAPVARGRPPPDRYGASAPPWPGSNRPCARPSSALSRTASSGGRLVSEGVRAARGSPSVGTRPANGSTVHQTAVPVRPALWPPAGVRDQQVRRSGERYRVRPVLGRLAVADQIWPRQAPVSAARDSM
ncbi:MMPL family transporter [Kitasatospora sp. NPDC049285]|uniref:MMPL family transporter n=1 Tax=Kitasatospora sp. NPDC049285 TaxID=3157096 RepID=UPI0034326B79